MIRAGIFQCAAGGLDGGQRIERLDAAIRGRELDLVVCPELFLSGYNVGDDVVRLAESIDGPFREAIAELAQRHRTAIVYGYPERTDGLPFNSAVAIGADGTLLANHRKLVIPPGVEEHRFQADSGLTLFDLGDMRCAILICYDCEFGEAARAAALAGAEVIIVPTALVDQWAIVAEKLIPTRAFENGAWLLYANHAGEENGFTYLGSSCIVAPDGQDRTRAGAEESLIVAELDSASVSVARDRLPYLRDLPSLQQRL